MPSVLRPELVPGDGKRTVMTNGTAYYMILSAVQTQHGLIHGRLHNTRGEHCALGSFFDVNDHATVPWELVNEVAAVNDSVPHLSKQQRKFHVTRWLKWKLTQLGMPGFKLSKRKT